jgi:hypothetical protein
MRKARIAPGLSTRRVFLPATALGLIARCVLYEQQAGQFSWPGGTYSLPGCPTGLSTARTRTVPSRLLAFERERAGRATAHRRFLDRLYQPTWPFLVWFQPTTPPLSTSDSIIHPPLTTCQIATSRQRPGVNTSGPYSLKGL